MYGGWSWLIDVPYWIWGFDVKDQGHSDIVAQNLVRSITWEHIDLVSLNFVWRLLMTSRWPLLNFGFCVKGHSDIVAQNLVWLITLEHIDLGSLNFVWRLFMTSRWPLLNFGFLRQRSQWHCSSKHCLINNFRTHWPRIFSLCMEFGHD